MTEQTIKKRHGCLTAWLILMIVANSAMALFYLLGMQIMKEAYPNVPVWLFLILTPLGVFNLICAIALFNWKKWGFWGFCVSSVIAMIVNIFIGLGIGQSVAGLLGIAFLYGILQIGKDNKGWPQLN